MSELISRNAIIQMFNTADRYVAESLKLCDADKVFPQNEVFIVDDMYEALDQLPSAEPEIVRCEDCREFRRYIDTDITFCDRTEAEVKCDDFCSRAKKMEVEYD